MKALSEDIQRRSREMDRQRSSALVLLKRQKCELQQQVQKIPLPVMIGLALVGGFLTQRLFRTRVPSRAFRLFLRWRKL
ncbi:hypothetical protein [Microbulbifer taiwanensis]|uniref:hypothetical protein n=1 Tax=Microbulbifer taiwanensis TaxID=986746 RepID=UPI0018660B05